MALIRSMLHRLEETVRARLASRASPARSPQPPTPQPQPAPEPAPAPPPKPVNWELRTQAELVDHILDHYHAGLRRDLPALIMAARGVEREHAAHAQVPRGLADLLEAFESELESHMGKEERILFPMLRTGSRGGPIDMPIRMMEREHEGHDRELAQIRELTHDFAVPDDASIAWRKLYTNLATLEADLHQHIYLENNVLFARALGGEY